MFLTFFMMAHRGKSVISCFLSADKILALSHCGGHVSLEEPAGHMNLTLPGLYTDPANADETPLVSVCTWLIGIPLGRKVLLTPLWLDSGSNVTVRCVWNEEHRFLESGGAVVLSHCDKNKATLSWRGARQSSNLIQLSYGMKPFLSFSAGV